MDYDRRGIYPAEKNLQGNKGDSLEKQNLLLSASRERGEGGTLERGVKGLLGCNIDNFLIFPGHDKD